MTFKSADLKRFTTASATDIDYWVKSGALIPLRDAKTSGEHRLFTLAGVVECAIARVLTQSGLSVKQVAIVLSQVRATVKPLPPERRAAGTYVKFVEMVEGLVKINGPFEGYAAWHRATTKEIATWQRKPAGGELAETGRLLDALVAFPHAAARQAPARDA